MTQPFKNDLTGKMFGSLYVRKYAGKVEKDGHNLWECRCYSDGCYRILNIRAESLLQGRSKSCGCVNISHGLTRGVKSREDKPTEYKSWIHAKGRCFNPENAAYSDYGARGIVMCSGWKNDFGSFFRDLGPKPDGKSLDRLDNNLNYSCGHCEECLRMGWKLNCAWRTPKEQCRNRRSTVMVEYNGKTQALSAWAEELGINLKVLCARLKRYKLPIAIAFSKKVP